MHVFLETGRMILRRLTVDDVDALHALDLDPEVTRYTSGGRATPREEIVERILPRILGLYERYGLGYWAAIERESDTFLGWFQLCPFESDPGELELGYRLTRKAWGRGLATEGAHALVHAAFADLSAGRIVARALVENAASTRVIEKVGLRLERRYREPDFPGPPPAAVFYALDRAEWIVAGGP